MGSLKVAINNFFHMNMVDSVIIIIINLIIYNIIHNLVLKSMKSNSLDKKISNKSRTYLRLITSILRYIFIILTVLILLQINNIDVSSMLAGLGIISVIVGLAVQDALKDIIKGFSLLADEYFAVGDIITIDGITGKVLVLGLKSTKIKDIATNNIITIANRNIERAEIVSHSIYINIPVAYEVPVERAEEVIGIAIEEIKHIKHVDNVIYKGLNKLEDSSLDYLIEIDCMPEKKLQIRRDALKVIVQTLRNNNVEIPYKKIDIYNK